MGKSLSISFGAIIVGYAALDFHGGVRRGFVGWSVVGAKRRARRNGGRWPRRIRCAWRWRIRRRLPRRRIFGRRLPRRVWIWSLSLQLRPLWLLRALSLSLGIWRLRLWLVRISVVLAWM